MNYELTKLEQTKFEEELNNIINQSSNDIQKLWGNNNTINWAANIPIIESGVQFKLKGKQADQYNSLMNKVKSGRLLV